LTPEVPAQEGEAPGRVSSVRTGASRSASPNNITPNKFSARLFDHFTAPEQGVEFSFTARTFWLTMPTAAHIVVDSNE